jgi:serine phosphatase RsbU (regulator of sigma subunit)
MSLAESTTTRSVATLEALSGTAAGEQYKLNVEKSVMGRHPDCQIIIDSGAVSRQHAQILMVGNDYFIEDLKSRNGTFVNDHLISERTALNDGDMIRICDLDYAFHRKLTSQNSKTVDGTGGNQTVSDFGFGVVMDEDEEEGNSVGRSSVMSRLDLSQNSNGGFRIAANAEAKLRAVLEITQNLGGALSLEAVLPKLLDSLFKIFLQADRGVVALKSKDGKIVPRAVKLRRGGDDETIRLSRTIVNQVLESKQAILSADAATDERFELSQSIADFRIRSMMCAPLISSNGEALGLIQIDSLDQRQRFQEDDLEVLVGVATQSAFAIDNVNLHTNLLRQLSIERDLDLAHKVQQGILPSTPPTIPNYHFFDFYESAYQVGGDFYDYIPLSNGRLAVILADVSGKGVSAALVMARFSADVRFSLAMEPDLAAAVTKINADFCRNRWEDRFVTFVLLVLDPQKHEVTIVNAGHMAPFLRVSPGKVVSLFEEEAGMPLGVMDSTEYVANTLQLEAGQFIAIFTDGVSEAMNPKSELYTLDRLSKVLAAKVTSVAELGQTILSDVRDFVSGFAQSDDMCLICIGREK